MSGEIMDFLNRYPHRDPESVGRILDGEAVVVTPSDSQMHTMNEVGTWLWEKADGSRTVKEIVQELISEFDVEEAVAIEDIRNFIELLMEKGIVRLSDEPYTPDAG